MVSDYVKWFGPTMGRDVGLLNSWQQNLRTSHVNGGGYPILTWLLWRNDEPCRGILAKTWSHL